MNKDLILKLVVVVLVIGWSVSVYQNSLDEKLISGDLVVEKNEGLLVKENVGEEVFVNESNTGMVGKEGSEVINLYEEDGLVPEKQIELEGSIKGKYINFSELDIKKENGIVVLNFYASWCSSCKSLKNDILNNTEKIPSGVTIVEVDYDTQKDLVKNYGVRYQHTLVQIGKDLNEITKWSGGNTLESILNKIIK
jgi:thiol-disulfide isomerase/thioredoxin